MVLEGSLLEGRAVELHDSTEVRGSSEKGIGICLLKSMSLAKSSKIF